MSDIMPPALQLKRCCCALQAEHQRQLTLVFQQHSAQVADLQRKTQVEEALKWRQHLAALEGQFQASRHACDQLQEELRAARQLVPWTPAAHEVLHPQDSDQCILPGGRANTHQLDSSKTCQVLHCLAHAQDHGPSMPGGAALLTSSHINWNWLCTIGVSVSTQ